MQQNHLQSLFKDSFETFNVFDDLTLEDTGSTPVNGPKTIWQILNHLIAWQNHQLIQIKNIEQVFVIDEEATWVESLNGPSQNVLYNAIDLFKQQLSQLKGEILTFNVNDKHINQKIKLVQDLSVHLSFHVGEVVLIRRLAGTYPLPHQMKGFLDKD